MLTLTQYVVRGVELWTGWDTALAIVLVVAGTSWIACGFFAAKVAGAKGYNGSGWLFLGLLFGWIALLAAAGLPNAAVASDGELGPRKACPDCANRCALEARICWACQFEFAREETVKRLCDALVSADAARAQRIEEVLRGNLDGIAVDELERAASSAGWQQLPTFARLLVEAGAVQRMEWLIARVLAESAYDLDPTAVEALHAIAGTRTEIAARLLLPLLGRFREAAGLYEEIGVAAVPVLRSFAASAAKHAAKLATRLADSIESAA